MAAYTTRLGIGRLHIPLVLGKTVHPERTDEIDTVASAINSMRENLLRDIQERQETEARITFAEAYIRNILDSMPSVLVSVDTKGRVTQWNLQAARLTGVTSKQAIGCFFEEIFLDAPVSMPQILEAIDRQEPLRLNSLAEQSQPRPRRPPRARTALEKVPRPHRRRAARSSGAGPQLLAARP